MALFRFSVVSLTLSWLLRGEVRARAVEAAAAQEHATPWGDVRRVSRRTVYRWLAAYERYGLVGLEPAPRARTDSSVVLPAAFVAFLRREKEVDPRASSPELIRRAQELGILKPQTPVDRTTVWRTCRRMGLPTRRRPHKREADTRRFAYPHRMMMVLADGKQFRAGAARLKRVALFFLDDCTRYGLHAIVGTRECTDLFLRGLHQLLRKVGFFDVIFLDRGPGFISDDTTAVIAHLPHGHLVHGTARYPEGHGKIEIFHSRCTPRAVLRRGCLVGLDAHDGLLIEQKPARTAPTAPVGDLEQSVPGPVVHRASSHAEEFCDAASRVQSISSLVWRELPRRRGVGSFDSEATSHSSNGVSVPRPAVASGQTSAVQSFSDLLVMPTRRDKSADAILRSSSRPVPSAMSRPLDPKLVHDARLP